MRYILILTIFVISSVSFSVCNAFDIVSVTRETTAPYATPSDYLHIQIDTSKNLEEFRITNSEGKTEYETFGWSDHDRLLIFEKVRQNLQGLFLENKEKRLPLWIERNPLPWPRSHKEEIPTAMSKVIYNHANDYTTRMVGYDSYNNHDVVYVQDGRTHGVTHLHDGVRTIHVGSGHHHPDILVANASGDGAEKKGTTTVSGKTARNMGELLAMVQQATATGTEEDIGGDKSEGANGTGPGDEGEDVSGESGEPKEEPKSEPKNEEGLSQCDCQGNGSGQGSGKSPGEGEGCGCGEGEGSEGMGECEDCEPGEMFAKIDDNEGMKLKPDLKQQKESELILYLSCAGGKVYQVNQHGHILGFVSLPNEATGLALSDGLICSIPRDGGKIVKITDKGSQEVILEYSSEMVHPVDVAQKGGILVVGDNISDRIFVLSEEGENLQAYQEFPKERFQAQEMSVAIGRDSKVLYGTNKGIFRYKGSDYGQEVAPVLEMCGQVASDSATTKWAATQGDKIVVLDGNEPIQEIQTPAGMNPYRICFGVTSSIVSVLKDGDDNEVVMLFETEEQKETKTLFQWKREEILDLATGPRMYWESNHDDKSLLKY